VQEHADATRAAVGGPVFPPPARSQWLVETGESPDGWAQRLYPVIDAGDRLLICEVTNPTQGWLSGDSRWLSARARTRVA
jgi:hypothetical protein